MPNITKTLKNIAKDIKTSPSCEISPNLVTLHIEAGDYHEIGFDSEEVLMNS